MNRLSTLTLLILAFGAGILIGLQINSSDSEQTHISSLSEQTLISPTAETVTHEGTQNTHCNCQHHIPSSVQQVSTSLPQSDMSIVFSQLLTAQQYDEAIGLYHTVSSVSENDASIMKELYIQHLYELAKYPKSQAARLMAAIDSYLQDFYSDIEVLLILAQQYAHTEQVYEALNTLQLASSYALDDSAKNKVLKQYDLLISQINNTLFAEEDWGQLINIYTYAEGVDLLRDKDRFALMVINLNIGNQYETLRIAERLSQTPALKPTVDKFLKEHNLLETPEQELTIRSDYDSQLALTRHHNQFIVPVVIAEQEFPLLIDTGASITTISKAHFDKIARDSDLSFLQSQTFLTANGRTSGKVYRAKKLLLGEYELQDIRIAVLDYPTSKASTGLLGMNVLQHFQFKIDQQNATMHMSKHH